MDCSGGAVARLWDSQKLILIFAYSLILPFNFIKNPILFKCWHPLLLFVFMKIRAIAPLVCLTRSGLLLIGTKSQSYVNV